jgi:hypothetical protein
MATKINPKPLRGVWTAGYALDFHTTRSVFAGHDEFGHRVFDTLRPPMGELLYRLKYGMDRSVVPEIARTARTISRFGQFLSRRSSSFRRRENAGLFKPCSMLGLRLRD